MTTLKLSAATRLVCALAAGAALSGCAAYGPAYPAYPDYGGYATAPVGGGYPAASYYGYGYGYGYDDPYYGYSGYGGPAYVRPGLALDFRFHDNGYRGGSRHDRGYADRDHAWTGSRGGDHHWGGDHHSGGEHQWGGGPHLSGRSHAVARHGGSAERHDHR